MVACVQCGAEVERSWHEITVKVSGHKGVPIWTRVDTCPSCGAQLLYLQIEPTEDSLLIEGVHDGEAE